jgi:hypothetical protein
MSHWMPNPWRIFRSKSARIEFPGCDGQWVTSSTGRVDFCPAVLAGLGSVFGELIYGELDPAGACCTEGLLDRLHLCRNTEVHYCLPLLYLFCLAAQVLIVIFPSLGVLQVLEQSYASADGIAGCCGKGESAMDECDNAFCGFRHFHGA